MNWRRLVCALLGHSRVQVLTEDFGTIECFRCRSQCEWSERSMFIGHDCRLCRENTRTLTWRDRFATPAYQGLQPDDREPEQRPLLLTNQDTQ